MRRYFASSKLELSAQRWRGSKNVAECGRLRRARVEMTTDTFSQDDLRDT